MNSLLFLKTKKDSLPTRSQRNRGFTLVEVMIAIFVFLVGVVGIYALLPRAIKTTTDNNNRFIAAQLAREGIEIVRNIRDENWLSGDTWDNGISSGDYEADYTAHSLSQSFSPADKLKIDADGFYNYSNGKETIFTRKINVEKTIDADSNPIIKVTVTVSWGGTGKTYKVQEYLYDWR